MTVDRAQFSRRGFLGLGVAAGVITLTACGSGSGASDAPLVMTVWGGDPDRKTYQARIDLLVKKYPELKVKLQLIPNDSYPQKVQTMIAGGSGPDIMQVAESVNTYSSKSQLLPLDDLAKKANLDPEQRFGPVGSLYAYQDKLYAIPDRSGAVTVFYNKGMFDKKGIKAPTADWTWDDALDAFKELTVPGKVWGYSGAEWWPQWWSLAYQNGGTIIDAQGRPRSTATRSSRRSSGRATWSSSTRWCPARRTTPTWAPTSAATRRSPTRRWPPTPTASGSCRV